MNFNVPVSGLMFIVCLFMLLPVSNINAADYIVTPTMTNSESHELFDSKEPTFKRIVIGQALEEFSCESSSTKVIFRNDRIEFIDMSDNQANYFFLVFDNVDEMKYQGVDLIDQTQSNIQGSPIARVLKSNIKEIYQYSRLTTLVDGRHELTVQMTGDQLEILIPKGLDLNMHLFNAESFSQRSSMVTSVTVGQKNVEISSDDFSFNSSKGNWEKVNPNSDSSLLKISL